MNSTQNALVSRCLGVVSIPRKGARHLATIPPRGQGGTVIFGGWTMERLWWLHHPSRFTCVLFACISGGYHSLP